MRLTWEEKWDRQTGLRCSAIVPLTLMLSMLFCRAMSCYTTQINRQLPSSTSLH